MQRLMESIDAVLTSGDLLVIMAFVTGVAAVIALLVSYLPHPRR